MHEFLRIMGFGLCSAILVFWTLTVLSRTKNRWYTSKDEIARQMNEPRPLPMGVQEFEVWSDRILAGAQIPSQNTESLKNTLLFMIHQLGPTESHKPDAFFIHSLRKAAANQVADGLLMLAKEKKKKQMEAEGLISVSADAGTVTNLNQTGA